MLKALSAEELNSLTLIQLYRETGNELQSAGTYENIEDNDDEIIEENENEQIVKTKDGCKWIVPKVIMDLAATYSIAEHHGQGNLQYTDCILIRDINFAHLTRGTKIAELHVDLGLSEIELVIPISDTQNKKIIIPIGIGTRVTYQQVTNKTNDDDTIQEEEETL